MEKIEKTENQIVFKTETSETLANSIRRYLNQIPVMAIDDVEISKNDSPLYDEAIAHRLGLVPLKTDKGVNEKSTGKLKLKVEKEGIVHSGELKGEPSVVYKGIPITTLAEGQEIEIVANVKSGKGSEHAKFSPGLMFYRNVSEVTLDKSFSEEVKSICPDNEIKEKSGKIVITDDQKKEVLDVLESLAQKKGKKAEVEPKNQLVITLESFGQISPEEMFRKSIEALEKDLANFEKAIDKVWFVLITTKNI